MKFGGVPEPWMIDIILAMVWTGVGFCLGLWAGIRMLRSDLGNGLKMSGWSEFNREEKLRELQMIMIGDSLEIIGPCWAVTGKGFVDHHLERIIPFDRVSFVRPLLPGEDCSCDICNEKKDRARWGLDVIDPKTTRIQLSGVVFKEF